MSRSTPSAAEIHFLPGDFWSDAGREKLLNQLIALLPQSPYSPSSESVERFLSECALSQTGSGEQKLLALAVMADKALCGFAQFRFFGADCDLDFILIDVNYRGKGHAKLILEKSFVWLKKSGVNRVVLEVSHRNSSALALYGALGFNQLTVRKKYYRNGEDAVIMEKQF
jgi:ribosomal protein S18 acetylase RimI-like enzyme